VTEAGYSLPTLTLILGTIVIASLGLGSYWLVTVRARGAIWVDVATVPRRACALVLGCGPELADGRPNLFFELRMQAAAALFHQKRVEQILVSGDAHGVRGDEPRRMRLRLAELGVPDGVIIADGDCRRTWDSIRLARERHGLRTLTLVSQRFHLERALYQARSVGIDAIGYAAADVDGAAMLRMRLRELVARARLWVDVALAVRYLAKR